MLDVADVWNQAGSRCATDLMSFDPSHLKLKFITL